MLVRVLAMALCLSVSFRLSQVSVLSKGVDGSSCFLARRLPSTNPALCYKEIQIHTKRRALPSSVCIFVGNSGVGKYRHGMGPSIVATCYELSSTNVDASSVINWAVVVVVG